MSDDATTPHTGPQPPSQPGAAALRRALLWAGIVAVLLAVFAAYLRPDMAFQMAQQLWSCF